MFIFNLKKNNFYSYYETINIKFLFLKNSKIKILQYHLSENCTIQPEMIWALWSENLSLDVYLIFH